MSTPSNFVTIDDTTPVHPVRPADSARPPASCARPDSRSRPATCRTQVKSEPAAGRRSITSLGDESAVTVRYNYADGLNENIEPWGGLVARSRGAVARQHRPHVRRVAHGGAVDRQWSTSCDSSSRGRDQNGRLARSATAAVHATGEDQGGPTLEILGVASVGRQRFTPQPRLNDRYQVLDTLSYFTRQSPVEGRSRLQLRRPQGAGAAAAFRRPLPLSAAAGDSRPAAGAGHGDPGARARPARRLHQGYGNSTVPLRLQRSVALRAGRLARRRSNLTREARAALPESVLAGMPYNTPGVSDAYAFPTDNNNIAPRVAVSWDPAGNAKTIGARVPTAIYYDNLITSVAGIVDIIDGARRRAHAASARGSRPRSRRGTRRATSLPEAAAGDVSQPRDLDRPGARRRRTRIISRPESIASCRDSVGLVRQLRRTRAASISSGTIDYNPVVPSLGAGRRPLDVNGVAGTSASVLQYTAFGDTWYNGLTLAVDEALQPSLPVPRQLHAVEGRGHLHRLSERFHPAEQRTRTRSDATPTGLPIGFDPDSERGPSLQDQRHRLVASGIYTRPLRRERVSTIITVESGRPYNITGGRRSQRRRQRRHDSRARPRAHESGDPATSDRTQQRARCRRRRPWTCA